MDDLPYAAPKAVVADNAGAPRSFHIAGRWRRLFNWLIDKIVIMMLGALVFALLYAFGSSAVVAWLDGLTLVTEQLACLPLYLGYYMAMEGLFGVTLGKLLTGTRVVDERGHRILLRHALLRSMCRLIPFDALSVLMSDDSRIRGWHDSLADTYVVLRVAPAMAVAASGSEPVAAS
ncbi:RDD family protein [Lysobacter panacisoli]|uniref:RDD domain-containing protein n=1 Tax=Lysobacter panacisoli TaxID=1255263 RepID=A0ABP9KX67_9GAMM|nr:RDD family protein [Lysobacter panacisoli]